MVIEVKFQADTDQNVNDYVTHIYMINSAVRSSEKSQYYYLPSSTLYLSAGARCPNIQHSYDLSVSAEYADSAIDDSLELIEQIEASAIKLKGHAIPVINNQQYLIIPHKDQISIVGTTAKNKSNQTTIIESTTNTPVNIYWYLDGLCVGVSTNLSKGAKARFQSKRQALFVARELSEHPAKVVQQLPKKTLIDLNKTCNGEINVLFKFSEGKPCYEQKPL